MDIIVPSPLAQLCTNPKDFKAVYHKIEAAVWKSFQEDALRVGPVTVTTAETKRRVEICAKWFKILQAEYGWSFRHALDYLGAALRAELDGQTLSSTTKQTWVVPDSQKKMEIEIGARDYAEEVKQGIDK